MRRARLHLPVLIFLMTSLAGCTLRQAVARSTGAVVDDFLAAMNAEPDPVHAREAAASLFVMIEGLLRADPANADLRRA
ncbi:MAG: hypothetical protein HYU38_00430, partial [Candidatus Tectomicrobia bacterium]|nr:hypothetical protein [Candidatus Tectomicrobia bacterium]